MNTKLVPPEGVPQRCRFCDCELMTYGPRRGGKMILYHRSGWWYYSCGSKWKHGEGWSLSPACDVLSLMKERNSLERRITQLETMSEDLREQLTKEREWAAGAQGALMLFYPPKCGPHTTEAFVAHRERYLAGSFQESDPYCAAADEVALAWKARSAKLQSDIADLRAVDEGRMKALHGAVDTLCLCGGFGADTPGACNVCRMFLAVCASKSGEASK